MKLTKERLILLSIIIVLILYLLFHNSDRTLYQLPEINKIKLADISRIEIIQKGKDIILEKRDKNWQIDPKGYPADPDKIDKILNMIANLTVTELISKSKNYLRYDLTDDKKLTLKGLSGNTLKREIDIGKTASTHRHTHIRLPGDPNVYFARGDFRRDLDVDVNDLRDMKILSFIPGDIQQISIFRGKAELHLSQMIKKVEADKDNQGRSHEIITWQTDEGKTVETTDIDELFYTLSDIDCEKYLDNRPKSKFKDPVFTVKLKSNILYELSVFEPIDKESKDFPGISATNNYTFELSESTVKTIKDKLDKVIKYMRKP